MSKVHYLPNGFTVISIRDISQPIVSMQIFVEAGSFHEQEHCGSGLAHLVEHMVFAASKQVEADTFRDRVAHLGGTCGAQTRQSHTRFQVMGPASQTRHLLHLLIQLVFHPTFPEDLFKRELGIIEKEMDMMENNENEQIYHAILEAVRGTRRTYHSPIGIRNLFRRLDINHVRDFHRTWYSPNNSFICIAGDIDEYEVLHQIDEEMAGLCGATCPVLPYFAEPATEWPEPVRIEKERKQSTLLLAWRIPTIRSISTQAADVLCTLLNENSSDLLLRHSGDISPHPENIHCSILQETAEDRIFVISASVLPSLRDRLRDRILYSLGNLCYSKLESHITRTKGCLHMALLRQISSVQGLTGVYSHMWHMERRTDLTEFWHKAMEQISAHDLLVLSRELFCQKFTCEASIDPPAPRKAISEPPSQLTAPETRDWILPNGLRVITRRDSLQQTLHATLSIASGCRNETAEIAGINHLFSRCLQNVARKSHFNPLRAFAESGGSITFNRGNHCIHITGSTIPSQLENLLASLFYLVTIPDEFKHAVEQEQARQLFAIQNQNTSLPETAFRELRLCCFGNASYGIPRLGSEESVRNITVNQLTNYVKQQTGAGNLVLSISGNTPFSEIERLAERYSYSLTNKQPIAPAATPLQRRISKTFRHKGTQSCVAMALAAETALSEDLAQMMLFSEWCRSTAGPVFQELRLRKGLAYQAFSSELVGMDAGCIMFYVATSAEQSTTVRASLEALFEKIFRKGIKTDELRGVQRRLHTNRLFQQQYGDKICESMALNIIMHRNSEADSLLMERIRTIGMEDMQAYLRKLLDNSNIRTWLTILPDNTIL
ncbi:hypothetical protein CXU13_01340 [Akkermansia muciniphila]|nr:hypothetical protein CXU12_12940 [Akkermansia muciniphila]PNC61278.1 hypothetical protein CXU13_01340 [Akkermansia muciniphila]